VLDIVAECTGSGNRKIHVDGSRAISSEHVRADHRDVLAYILRQLTFLPLASLEDTTVHGEVRLQDAITRASRSGL